MVWETAIVVGASSGIGEAMVRQLAAAGTRVVAVARREAELARIAAAAGGGVIPMVHDVCRLEEAAARFAEADALLGGAALLIYNAGVMPRLEEGEASWEKDRVTLEVNLLGAVAWLGAGAAAMRARGAGTLVGISSVAGDRGRRGNPAYHASKAGLTTYLEGLRNRVDRDGVKVVTVKPGPVRTPMTEGLRMPLMISAEEAATGALALAAAGAPEGYVPRVWGPIMRGIQAIPSPIFRRTNL